MKTQIKIFENVFQNESPTLISFKAHLATLSIKKQEELFKTIWKDSFVQWSTLEASHKHFISTLIRSYREQFTCYMLKDTPLAETRLAAADIDLLLTTLCLIARLQIIPKTSYVHIASNFLVCFDIDLKTRSMTTYLHTKEIKIEKLLQIIGKCTADDEYMHL